MAQKIKTLDGKKEDNEITVEYSGNINAQQLMNGGEYICQILNQDN